MTSARYLAQETYKSGRQDWLQRIITKNNYFCCGICIGNLEKALVEEGLKRIQDTQDKDFAVLSIKNRSMSLSILDPITKGKLLQIILIKLKNVDLFDEVNPHDYSHFLFYLERFFTRSYLKEFYKDTYIGEILLARRRKELVHKIKLEDILRDQKEKKRIRLLLKSWNETKRMNKKKARDDRRLKFLKHFQKLNPVTKLELILKNETSFPYQCIPDNYLFKVNLKTRHIVQKRFNSEELGVLRIKFGSQKKKNKRPGWVRILKAL